MDLTRTTVSWDSPDTVQTTNAQPDSASVGITIAPIADVAVTNIANAPDPIKVGVAMTYTTSIKNNGPSTAAGVVLRHVFEDSKMAYQTGTASLTGSGDTCTFVNSFVGAPHAGLSGIECTGFSMTDGESRQLTFDVLPTFLSGAVIRLELIVAMQALRPQRPKVIPLVSLTIRIIM